jgi:hypothetical protein
MENGLCGRKHGHGMKFFEVLGGVALIAVVAGLLFNFSDIKRYIQISRM